MTIKSSSSFALVALTSALLIHPATAQVPAPAAPAAPAVVAPAGPFEEPPLLEAAAILQPVYLSGPVFTVRRDVITYAGQNQFIIDSEFGVFDAGSNTELVERVREIEAIAKLREISRTDEYKTALKTAAQSPVKLAKDLAANPVKTISGVPKGIWKFMNRTGQAVKEASEERQRTQYEDGAGADLVGFSKAKRDLALRLGVDPYSSNAVFQRELNGISWAAFAGSMTINLALAPVGGGAGAVITAVNVAGTTQASLRDSSPNDLRRASLAKLLAMDVPREDAVAFLNCPAYSPTNQTLFVDALETVKGATGRDELVRLAAEATDETDALFFRRSAQVMAKVNLEQPLAVVSAAQHFPICLAKDGTVIVPLEWDYASWTERAAKFLTDLKAGDFGKNKITGYRVVLTGVASPLARQGMTAMGIALTEKALPGPLQ